MVTTKNKSRRIKMSSFKRATKASVPITGQSSPLDEPIVENLLVEEIITGVKPWVNTGLGIVSTGNKQLDDLIGGGVALGTLTLIESDGFSNYGETLLSYNLVESVSHKHPVFVVTEDEVEGDRLMMSLPYNQTVGSSGNNEEVIPVVAMNNPENKLTIAWQYAKYIKTPDNTPKKASSSNNDKTNNPTYCCSYDLSRRLQSSLTNGCIVELCPINRLQTSTTTTTPTISCTQSTKIPSIESQFLSIIEAIKSFIIQYQRSNKSITRIVLSGFDQILASIARNSHISKISARLAGKFLLNLKQIIQLYRCNIMITYNSNAISIDTAILLRQVSDTLLSIESFAGRNHSVPYEFKEFQGFLVVHKIQQYGSLAAFRPPGTRFGLKRDRRKLHIEPLHLPPEESRAFSTTGGATSTAISSSTTTTGHVLSHTTASSGPTTTTTTTTTDGVGHISHTHDHAHDHTDNVSKSDTSSTTTHTTPPSTTTTPTVPTLTPLQASLAALKAARLAAQSGSSTNSNVATIPFAPVSIQRAAVPTKGINSGKFVPGGRQDSSNKAADSTTTPPLQPGQACGAQSTKLGNKQANPYDF